MFGDLPFPLFLLYSLCAFFSIRKEDLFSKGLRASPFGLALRFMVILYLRDLA